MSRTAVSFAFNQPQHLSHATRQRILSVAAELKYRPSPIARRLAARCTDQIGLAAPQPADAIFANPLLPELMRGIGDACDAEGIAVVIVPPVDGSIARSLDRALVDGLILLGFTTDAELEPLKRSTLPMVALDLETHGDASVVAVDYIQGGRQAAEHLRLLGHMDVAAILLARHSEAPGDEPQAVCARWEAGIRDGLGLPSESNRDGEVQLRFVCAEVNERGGRQAFSLLHADGLPTAVVAMSDIAAIGVMGAALDAGIRVPADLSVVGFGDVPAASWVSPRLSSVRLPVREQGRMATSRLIELIRSPGGAAPTKELLPTRLIVRDSTAPPGSSRPRGPSTGGGGAATS